MIMKQITTALHCVANWMDRFQGDLFIDFPKIYERWIAGDYVSLAVAKMHSMIIGVGPYSLESLKKSLGVDFVISFRNNDIYLENIRLSDEDFRYIKYDLITFDLSPIIIKR
jgi:hypothetical protein